MKIIMRRDSMIFYLENHRIDNAVRRCLSDKTKWFYQIIVLFLDGNRAFAQGEDFAHKCVRGPNHRGQTQRSEIHSQYNREKILQPILCLRHQIGKGAVDLLIEDPGHQIGPQTQVGQEGQNPANHSAAPAEIQSGEKLENQDALNHG